MVIRGEAPQWEGCEQTRDAVAPGMRKAFIAAGPCNSEEARMDCPAQWLRKLTPGVPVTFVRAGDPCRTAWPGQPNPKGPLYAVARASPRSRRAAG
jgi:hypothetical protein